MFELQVLFLWKVPRVWLFNGNDQRQQWLVTESLTSDCAPRTDHETYFLCALEHSQMISCTKHCVLSMFIFKPLKQLWKLLFCAVCLYWGPSVILWCLSVQVQRVGDQKTQCYCLTEHVTALSAYLCQIVLIYQPVCQLAPPTAKWRHEEQELCNRLHLPAFTDWSDLTEDPHLAQLIGWFDEY